MTKNQHISDVLIQHVPLGLGRDLYPVAGLYMLVGLKPVEESGNVKLFCLSSQLKDSGQLRTVEGPANTMTRY